MTRSSLVDFFHKRKALGWGVMALVVANEIRGIIVVAAIGGPILKALWR